MTRIYFITGTDTGVGKTVLTALFVRHLRMAGVRALAVKPFCSGGRDDARVLRRAQNEEATLDELNPWYFRAPLAPLLAARREKQRVTRKEAMEFLRKSARRCDVLLIEGAGGLLSPLGEGFDALSLIEGLKAIPIVVGRNRLGAINQVRLVLVALPDALSKTARVALMPVGARNPATKSNAELLTEFIMPKRLLELPRVDWPAVVRSPRLPAGISRLLDRWCV